MDSGLFHQKMKDLKQKLSSINDDIVEIQKNQKNNQQKNSFVQNKNQPINTNSSNYQIPKKSITNHNKTINNEETLNYLSSNNINKDFLYNLTTPSPSETPQITPNKKIYINENFYETLEGNRIKKNLEKDLTEENNNNLNNYDNNKLKNKYTYSNIIFDDEMSFRQHNNENMRIMNKLSNVLSPTRNPINLRINKRTNIYSMNNINKDINTEHNRIKDLINNKCNDNLSIDNNNTIYSDTNNNTIANRNKIIRRKIIPIGQNNNVRSDVFNFYSLVSPKNKNWINDKSIFFEIKPQKNKINNISNDYELIRNETQTYIQNNNYNKLTERILGKKGDKYFSGKILKFKKVIIDNNKENNKNTDFNENIEIKNKKKMNINNLLNKRKINSLSNKLLLNGNTLINDKSNKLNKIQNKIFNISDNIKSNINIDKEKLIVKINKQLYKNNKKHYSYRNSKGGKENNKIRDSKGEKKENEISSDIINKLNQNIVESKITNNFILKLIKLYYESTGLTINKENDLNSTLSILYNWIENINKKFYFENKKISQDLQYKILRQQIMNQYQLKNKNELKLFLFKILGND